MKVKELIETLLTYDQELDIVLTGYEGGVTETVKVSEEWISLNAHEEWYYGEHEIEDDEHILKNYPSKKVIYISR